MDKNRGILFLVVGLLIGIMVTPFVNGSDLFVLPGYWSHDTDNNVIAPNNVSVNVSMNNNSLVWTNLSEYAGNNIEWNSVTMQFDGESADGIGNPFNQDLNTTDDVSFDEITIAQFILGKFGGAIDLAGDPWYLSGTSFQIAENLTVNNNIDVGGYVNASYFVGDGSRLTGVSGGVYNSTNLNMSVLKTPNQTTLQDWFDTTQSSGKISGGNFRDNGDGTVEIGGGTGVIRASGATDIERAMFFNWSEDGALALTDDTTNYIYVKYNSGSPIVGATVTKSDCSNRDCILLGKVFREGTELHLVEAGMLITEATKNILSYITQVNGEVVRASGFVVGEYGERYLTSTNGVLFAGITRITTTGINTSGADTFEYYYYDGDLGDGEWVVNDVSQIDNANWNDVATGLDTLTSNRYGVHWVYGDNDGHLMVVYGQGDYTLTNAEEAQPPSSLPNHVSEFGFLSAKIIVQEGKANLYAVKSAYDTVFTPGGAMDHGELTGLADDDHPQYVLHTEIDSESELESELLDVSDVYTDNDFTANYVNWDTAFGWGNHADIGYLTYHLFGDPFFNASDAYHVTSALMDTWNSSASGNPFDQDLNTTDSPEFGGLTITGFEGIVNFSGGVAYDGAGVNNLSDVDTSTEPPSKHDVLMWNGNTWVCVPEGTVFTFSISAFSDAEATLQLIGSGVWQADETISFTASYNNGPPTTADVKMSINGGAYNDIGNMDAPAMTSGTNYDGDINYPASKDQYLRFRLEADDGEDSDTDYESSIYFRNYIYWGDTTTSGSFNEANVEALSGSQITNDFTQSKSITAGASEYIAWAYPASYTNLDEGDDYEDDGGTDFRFDGIAIAMTRDTTTLSITNSAGYAENYEVYVSDLANLGSGTFTTSTSDLTIDPLYYGKTTTASGYSEGDVEGLGTNEITNDNTQTWDAVTTGAGEYMLFAFPKRLGTVTFWVGGFEGGFESSETVSVTNSNGWTEDYYVWRSTNSNLGSTVVETT